MRKKINLIKTHLPDKKSMALVTSAVREFKMIAEGSQDLRNTKVRIAPSLFSQSQNQ